MCMFCRSLFVLLSFFFWPLCCLSFDLRILITHLVSSNSSAMGKLQNVFLEPGMEIVFFMNGHSLDIEDSILMNAL